MSQYKPTDARSGPGHQYQKGEAALCSPEQLHAWMTAHAYTRQALAAALEVSPLAVWHWLRGNCRVPRWVVARLGGVGALPPAAGLPPVPRRGDLRRRPPACSPAQLRAWMTGAGYTSRTLAEAWGTTYQTVYRWLHGQSGIPAWAVDHLRAAGALPALPPLVPPAPPRRGQPGPPCSAAEFAAWFAATGYSRRELARLWGVSNQAVGCWLRGTYAVPRWVAQRLAQEGAIPRGRVAPARRPGLQHEPLCTGPCRSCSARRWRATHRHASRALSEDFLARLRALAATHAASEIQRIIAAETGQTYQERTIRQYLRRVGVGSYSPHYTLSRIAHICGYRGLSVILRWVDHGLLPVLRPTPQHAPQVPAAAFEAFIRQFYGLLGVARMPVLQGPDRRWRELVWQLSARDPMYRPTQVAAYTGRSLWQVDRARVRGDLVAVRAFGRGRSSYLFRRSAVLRWAQAALPPEPARLAAHRYAARAAAGGGG